MKYIALLIGLLLLAGCECDTREQKGPYATVTLYGADGRAIQSWDVDSEMSFTPSDCYIRFRSKGKVVRVSGSWVMEEK